jgi:hypothetical protein
MLLIEVDTVYVQSISMPISGTFWKHSKLINLIGELVNGSGRDSLRNATKSRQPR